MEWRCFQCDVVFTDEKTALDHFGRNPLLNPICCDHSLATYQQVLRQLRETEDHAQTLYRQKRALEDEVERLRSQIERVQG